MKKFIDVINNMDFQLLIKVMTNLNSAFVPKKKMEVQIIRIKYSLMLCICMQLQRSNIIISIVTLNCCRNRIVLYNKLYF